METVLWLLVLLGLAEVGWIVWSVRRELFPRWTHEPRRRAEVPTVVRWRR